MTPVERIAQAMSLLGGCILPGGNRPASDCPLLYRPDSCYCRKRAVAAIEAFEPSEKMNIAGFGVPAAAGPEDAETCWNAMRRAAIEEG